MKHALFRLPPFVRASSLPAAWRAAFLPASGAASALLTVWLLLAMDQRALTLWRIHALLVGAAGPVSSLALLHALERAEAPMPLRLYAALPVVAAVATFARAAPRVALAGVRGCYACRGRARCYVGDAPDRVERRTVHGEHRAG